MLSIFSEKDASRAAPVTRPASSGDYFESSVPPTQSYAQSRAKPAQDTGKFSFSSSSFLSAAPESMDRVASSTPENKSAPKPAASNPAAAFARTMSRGAPEDLL